MNSKREPSVSEVVFNKVFHRECFGDPTKYLMVPSCRSVCKDVHERENCFAACYKSIRLKEEEFRKAHGHDMRYAETVYAVSKGRKGWGKDHEHFKVHKSRRKSTETERTNTN